MHHTPYMMHIKTLRRRKNQCALNAYNNNKIDVKIRKVFDTYHVHVYMYMCVVAAKRLLFLFDIPYNVYALVR